MRWRLCWPVLLANLFSLAAAAQTVSWSSIAIDDPGLDAAVSNLAMRALELPETGDAATRAAERAALQLAAGRYGDAFRSYTETRQLRGHSAPLGAVLIYALARQQESTGRPFEAACIEAYGEVVGALDDLPAFDVSWYLGRHPDVNRRFAQRSLARYTQPANLTRSEAVTLLRDVAWWRASQRLWPVLPRAIRADDERRYVIDEDLKIRTADGATITGILVRPRKMARAPTLLNFGIYPMPDSLDDARRTAAHGYAGVLGYSRGKYRSPDRIVPWEHDGDDARALIEWIASRPWSDGRVGMYGGSYTGFTQWSAARKLPKALKAMMPSAPTAPGISGPMERNVFMSYQYRFVPYVASGPMLDEAGYNDMEHWRRLDKEWYRSGRPYRDMDRIDGVPNPLYRRLLEHPAYDAYWQKLIPQGREFASIDIPVLTTTGYFDGALPAAQHYFEEFLRNNPRADYTLVIGPYTHVGAQRQSDATIDGHAVDPVAQLDVEALRYAWFDHVLKGAPRPELLRGRVNYQVMGANVWRQAASLEAMSAARLQWNLASAGTGATHRLATVASAGHAELIVDLADRSDADWLPPNSIVVPAIDTHNALAFFSDPLPAETDITGLVRAVLDIETNKQDFDLVLRLYEADSAGTFLELGRPYVQRMSFLRDRTRRQLLVPGKRERFEITKPGPVARRVKAGHRLVLVVGVQKQRDAQVNYGSDKDVSDESIADAGQPLRIRWYPDSVLSLPLAATQRSP